MKWLNILKYKFIGLVLLALICIHSLWFEIPSPEWLDTGQEAGIAGFAAVVLICVNSKFLDSLFKGILDALGRLVNNRAAKMIFFCLAVLFASSCSSKFMIRTLKNRGLLNQDTIFITDTIHDTIEVFIPGTVLDGGKRLEQLIKGDTLTIKDSIAETVVYFHNDSIKARTKVKPRTIEKPVDIPYSKKIPTQFACPPDPPYWKQNFFWFFIAACVINILLLVLLIRK